EKENLEFLIPAVTNEALNFLGRGDFEVILLDGGSIDGTKEVIKDMGVKFHSQKSKGYGNALIEGFNIATGDYLLTMDADLSHRPDFILNMWKEKESAEIIVASRYIQGGTAETGRLRKMLSIILNVAFRKGLSLQIRDCSSGFRLFRRDVIKGMDLEGEDFEILEEMLIKGYLDGWKIKEIPFHYTYRKSGKSHIMLKFVYSYLRTFVRMWKLRNSIYSADYDERAYFSRIPVQRYWQRRRHAIIKDFALACGKILDVGCGSSQTLRMFKDIIGLDISINKLRHIRKYGKGLVGGTIFALPFKNESFDCVVCSEVIEHVPVDEKVFIELTRVLKVRGILVLGTPDYGRMLWRIVEIMYKYLVPGGYANQHISHYSRNTLLGTLKRYGYNILDHKYVGGAEFIVKAVKEQNFIHPGDTETILQRSKEWL
ncbi:glycosyltransferase, partial [Candidatus Omnitrophota bacterium]